MSRPIFTPAERERLREALVSAAHADSRITGAAVTGSAAVSREDRWSDIDLALCVAAEADAAEVIADWTRGMYHKHAAVHHLDVMRGATLFRVFLLASTLQVDLAFWSAAEFGAVSPTFRLLFGTANERPMAEPPAAAALIGMGWLYARAARSSIARGRVWQAEYMVSNMRDQVLALACLRYRLPAVQGRGMDDLPPEFTETLTQALVRSLEPAELRRALIVTGDALRDEIGQVDTDLLARLNAPLKNLVG